MFWDQVRHSMLDELAKIADVRLDALSPETIMSVESPGPMKTPGYEKAKGILDMAQKSKTAAPRTKGYAIGMPQYRRMGEKPEGPPPTGLDRAMGAGTHAVAGMGIGKLMTDFGTHAYNVAKKRPPLKASPGVALGMMAGGGALGLAHYARKKHREAQFAKTSGSFTSPGSALKAARQVGTQANKIHQGPRIASQIRGALVGRKFTL